MGQSVQDRDLLPAQTDDLLALHHLVDGKPGAFQKDCLGRDAAEKVKAVGTGVADKDGVIEPFRRHGLPCGDGEGVVGHGGRCRRR